MFYSRYYSSDVLKIRILFTLAILFFVSFVMSCQELKYIVSGKTVDAPLVNDRIETTKYEDGHTTEKRFITYAFADNDKNRQERLDVPLDWEHPENNKVKIQYLAGLEDRSRLLGQHHYGWVIAFLSTIALFLLTIFLAGRQK